MPRAVRVSGVDLLLNGDSQGLVSEGLEPTRASLRLDAVELDVVNMSDAAELVARDCAAQRPCVVITPNIHHVRLARIDERFRAAMVRAEHRFADGWPLIVASRMLRPALPQRIAGIDLLDEVLTQSKGLRVAILGGPPGSAQRLAAKLGDDQDVVFIDGLPFGEWDTPDNIARIADQLDAAQPTLTLVGIGAPKQEILGDRLRNSVRGPIVCCGAAIEVLAGDTPRAPQVLRKTGLEWLFRMILEPRRLAPRYFAAGTGFTYVVAREGWRRSARRGPAAPASRRS